MLFNKHLSPKTTILISLFASFGLMLGCTTKGMPPIREDLLVNTDSTDDSGSETDSKNAETDSDSLDDDGHTGKDTGSDGETNTDSDTDTDADTDTGNDTDTDADTNGDAGVETDTVPEKSPGIPETCAEADVSTTTIGCLFYAVALDQLDTYESPYSVAVANVNLEEDAHVTVYEGTTGIWTVVDEIDVAPSDMHLFPVTAPLLESSGYYPKTAYKIVSDVPIVAYQFSPIDRTGDSASSDASLLMPVSAYDEIYDVIGWEGAWIGEPYFVVVAAHNGTEVTVTPSAFPAAGPGVPVMKDPFIVMMNEGDVLEISAAGEGTTLTGSRITTNEGHPVGVFTGHECALVPEGVPACDHLEEQMPGLQFWGTEFVASSLPIRLEGHEDSSVWRIFASEDDTIIRFTAAEGVDGLPESPLVLGAGEYVTFTVISTETLPGDFIISATHPIGVMQFMTGSATLPVSDTKIGDPAQVYLPPIDQFLDRHVVLVPETWENDYLVITRTAGVAVTRNGEVIPDEAFIPVAETGYETARIRVEDGVHRLESADPQSGLGVIVVGFDVADSYAYTGGMSTGIINPIIVI